MTEENGLNLEAIAEKYNLLATLDVDRVMKQLDVLDLIFEREDLIRIYNFVLTNSKSPDVLIYVISLADRFRNHSTLAVLIDTLLLKNTDGLNPKEKAYYTNVRVMSAKAFANYRATSAVTP